ncbi:related to catalase [Fusarium torulosum]|uniref:Related to catalase n=1 Tax=Fusarium torulosum TaxID=33205 RepID=A0AAE8SPF0_9HYPO|nr:related to catalase [Fusarium torulosum]
MADDWQSEFLTSRHVHNRQSRKSTARNTGSSSVLQAFGSYEVQCSSAEAAAQSFQQETALHRDSKKTHRRQKRPSGSLLQINSFTDNEDGLAGTLCLIGALDATIILAGSRKSLHTLLDEDVAKVGLCAGTVSGSSDEENNTQSQESETVKAPNDCSQHHTSSLAASGDVEEKELLRFNNFEKNTFRQPKFWFAWTGKIMYSPSAAGNATIDSADEELQSGMGYLVFSGSKYKKFQGTISCELLGWKDVAIVGWKR